MDNENTNLVSVTLIQDIPYFAKAGELAEIPEYQAAIWINAGTAALTVEQRVVEE